MATAVALPQIDEALKLQFAAVYVRENNAAAAAMAIIPDNPGRALMCIQTLLTDPIVVAEIARIKDNVDPKSLLPSKFDVARDIFDRAKLTQDNEEYTKLMRLYGDVMGFIEKPGANVDVSVQVANVMVVKDHGTDEQWASKARQQQQTLTLNAADERLTPDAAN